MKKTIAIIDTLGLCYDGTTLEKRGLGGSESAVILIAKELVKLDFDVTVYNACDVDDAKPGIYEGVHYKPLSCCENELADIVIASRSVAPFCSYMTDVVFQHQERLPDFKIMMQEAELKILWMHDTFCDGDSLIEQLLIDNRLDEVFTLSDFHTSYVTNCDHGVKRIFETMKKHIFQTRNGFKRHIDWVDISKKDPNLFVYNASVTKGMIPLIEDVWPSVIERLPDAKLKIIGGYYRFRDEDGPDDQEKMLHKLKEKHGDSIEFTGIIRQDEIAAILAEASFFIYPAAFPETFGISTLESLAYNTPVLTCEFGALEETAIDSACYKIPYSIEPNFMKPMLKKNRQVQAFVDMVLAAHANKYIHQQKMYACNIIGDECSWGAVALQWKQHFYKVLGEFLPVDEYREVLKINAKVHNTFGRRFMNKEEYTVPRNTDQHHFRCIVPFYNSAEYLEKCILSIATQDYDNYSVVLIDDASTDNAAEVIENTLLRADISPDVRNKFRVHRNDNNRGAVYNQHEHIWDINAHGNVIMLIDGDDWLINDNEIFHKYNNIYHEGAEMTYGSCWSLADNIPLIAQEYPPEVKANHSYRKHLFNWNMPYTHLRTFKRNLFISAIEEYDLKDENGNWFKAGGDGAIFYSLIEYADPDRVVCVPEVTYVYNDLNPLNDYKVNGVEQTQTANKILGKATERFTVVIPTMNMYAPFLNFLDKLVLCPEVDEIILINNSGSEMPLPESYKIREFNKGKPNIFVNPAWNLGVNEARNNLVCILNDDMRFDLKAFSKVREVLLQEDAGVIGMSLADPLYNQPSITDGSIDILPSDEVNNFGYGTLMFVRKDTWAYIPDDLEIYYGDYFIYDSYLHRGYKNYTITNMEFHSPLAQTTSVLHARDPAALDQLKEREHDNYEVHKNNMKSTKKILIAIPTARYIEPETFRAIYDLIIPEGYEAKFQYFYGYNIDQVRNLIAEWAVKGFDYLFAVDSDIAFAPDTLQKLLSHDKDVISGIYRQRLEEQLIEIYDVDYSRMNMNMLNENKPIQIGACGFGCVLVKSHVFKSVGYPQFEYHSALDHNHTFSEDLDFCKKARANGFEIWVDPTIICNHYGKTNYPVKPADTISKAQIQERLRNLSNADLLPQDHKDFLNNLSVKSHKAPDVIYDIGACVLHWTKEAKQVWPAANIIAFDALHEACFLYEEANMMHWTGVLSDKHKTVKFNKNVIHPGGNSYFKENPELSPMADELFPEENVRYEQAYSLDDVVNTHDIPLPNLIKMDIQGAELDVLKGATHCLAHASWLILELQHKDYNFGAPKADEVIEWLTIRGWKTSGMFCGSDLGVDGDYFFYKED